MVVAYSAASMTDLDCLIRAELFRKGFTVGVKPRMKRWTNYSSDYIEPQCLLDSRTSLRTSNRSHDPFGWCCQNTQLLSQCKTSDRTLEVGGWRLRDKRRSHLGFRLPHLGGRGIGRMIPLLGSWEEGGVLLLLRCDSHHIISWKNSRRKTCPVVLYHWNLDLLTNYQVASGSIQRRPWSNRW